MRFRCRRCEETAEDTARMSRHVVEEHGRAEFGWDVIRLPEAAVERPVAWLSNVPIRVRSRLRQHR